MSSRSVLITLQGLRCAPWVCARRLTGTRELPSGTGGFSGAKHEGLAAGQQTAAMAAPERARPSRCREFHGDLLGSDFIGEFELLRRVSDFGHAPAPADLVAVVVVDLLDRHVSDDVDRREKRCF